MEANINNQRPNDTSALKVLVSDEERQRFCRLPEALFDPELYHDTDADTLDCKWFHNDMWDIASYYYLYKRGVPYIPEGHLKISYRDRDDSLEQEQVIEKAYEPVRLRLKKVKQLIDKQARFMFGQNPDIKVEVDMEIGETQAGIKDGVDVLHEMTDKILTKNAFYKHLYKAYKDCTIGKRVAAVINFDAVTGVKIIFLTCFHFSYRYADYDKSKLIDFVSYQILGDCDCEDTRYIIKRYSIVRMDDGQERVKITERIFDHKCEDITEDYNQERMLMGEPELFDGITELSEIPAVIIINDGLTDECHGVSDVEDLEDYEEWLNMIGGLDIDALRQNMHPLRYTVDMDKSTTKHVSNRPGSYADLQTTRDDNDHVHPEVGVMQADLSKYTAALKNIQDDLNKNAYNMTDVPDISLETLSGAIASGKGLKAIYWGLIIRCDEKFKTWEPAIQRIVEIIISGCFTYPDIAAMYLDQIALPSEETPYQVHVERNNPLPEDEEEEKLVDVQQVAASLMSRKTYIMKWQNKTSNQANAEILQIALEKSVLEDNALPYSALSENELYKMLQEMGVSPENGTEEPEQTVNIDESVIDTSI